MTRRRTRPSMSLVSLPSLVSMMSLLACVSACAGDGTVTEAVPISVTSLTATSATDDTTASPVPETEPALPITLVDATGASVTVESVDRIVPVDGDLAEIVFALGLGERVVATDISATYPPEVDAVPDIGYQRALNPEPIAAVEPTVVLATDLAEPSETLEQLRDLDIAVVVIQREFTLDGPADKVQAVADALGVPNRGRRLVMEMQAEIEGAAERGRSTVERPRVLVLYLRGEQTQLIFGAGTGVDVILRAVGAVDVAAELDIVDTRQITAEALLAARPDVLVVTTTGLASVGGLDGFLAIPGIAETPAGEQHRILAYEDQYLLGAGPRFGQMLTELTADLHPERADASAVDASVDLPSPP